MTSKEALKKLEYFTNWTSDENIDKDLYNLWGNVACRTIKQALERLEVLERNSNKVIKDSVKLMNRNLELQQQNEKLKKAIRLLKLMFEFEVDVETETIYCCLGDVSLSGADLIEDFEELKEVLNNE